MPRYSILAAIFPLSLPLAAGAVSVEEFEAVSDEQQSQWLASYVLILEDWYNSNERGEIAACMERLRNRHESANANERADGLYSLIQREINRAWNIDRSAQVENIIAGVVEYECSR